jgi:PAS domain S-box-containing protein
MSDPAVRHIVILLVEDNPADVRLLSEALADDHRASYTITVAERLAQGLAELARQPFDVALVDLGLPDSQGLATLQQLQQHAPGLPIVVLSGQEDEDLALQAVHAGAQDYVVKGAAGWSALPRATRYAVERHQTWMTLQASEARYHQVLDVLLEGCQIIGFDWRYLYMNAAAAGQARRSAAELHNRTMMEIYPGIEDTPLFAELRDCMTGRNARRLENQFAYPDGSTSWFELCVQPVEEGLFILSADITERKQAAAARHESERQMHALVTSLDDIIFEIDAQGTLLNIWTANESLLARPKAEILGRRLREVIGGEPGGRYEEAVQRVLASGRPANIEYPLQVLGGQGWFTARISPILTPDDSHRTASVRVRDITEIKQTDAALRASEEKYRGLMESLDSVIATVDYDGTFLYMNDVAAQHLGGTAPELIGRTVYDLFPEPLASRQLATVRRVIDQDCSVATETETVVRGRSRWYRTMIQPIHDQGGRAINALLNSTDIHDLKTAQQDLLELNRTLEARVQERTAELQDLYDHAPAGYHSLDAGATFVRINQTELDWLGYSREEIIGVKTFRDLLFPPSQRIFDQAYELYKERGWVKDVEHEMVRMDGSILPVLLNATAIYDADGNFLRSRTTVIDLTERKAAEQALRDGEEQNRLLFEAAPESLILFDDAGRVVRTNHATQILTGYSHAELTGHTWDEMGLLLGEALGLFGAAIVQALLLKNSFATAEFLVKRADGELRDIGARIFGIKIRGRQHYLAAMRDITAEKEAAEILRQANRELEQAMRMKDEFLANMSHELRTPLSSILTLSELLLEQIRGPLNERQQSSLRNIQASGQHLLDLINDILDLSKVEAGRLELQVEAVPVADACQASLRLVTDMAAKKALTLGFQLNDQAARVQADPKRLKQMLVNLLANAVKFTPAGGRVSLEVEVDEAAGATAGAAGTIRFAVQDTGIGIAPEDLTRLFRPFVQLDASLRRQYEGTGLGLVLVQRLARLHGGSIAVESEVGQGSRFTITLPYRPPQAAAPERPDPASPSGSPAPAAAAAPPTGIRILLAEDNTFNVQSVGDYLENHGYQVEVALDGEHALALAARIRPALIIMDIQMPNMDGLEAMRRLRAMPDFAATPIIALTALAMPGDRERCLSAGANAYLAKPVSLQELIATIQRSLQE